MTMGARLLDWLREFRTVLSPIHPRDPALAEFFGAYRDAGSGMTVTERTAITWTAIASGIRLSAETIGMLPIDVVRREGRKRTTLQDHPAAKVLTWPNEETSGMEFRDVVQTQIDLWGTGYAQIIYDGARRPIALWQLPTDRVTIERNPRGAIQYRIGLPREPFGASVHSVVLPEDEVLRIRGWSRSGILGERMAVLFRESIGLGLATEYFGALFFGQGANAGGVLEHPGQLSDDAQKRLVKQKEGQIGSITKAHRIMILEEGMKWQQTTVEPEKAQFLGTRTFQILEACRILRLPPHVLYELGRATFSNIEHQSIELVTYSWLPRIRRWETRLAMQLLGPKDFYNTQIKFNLGGLLRGDMATQKDFFTAGIQNGWFSQNDVRELLDLNPIPDGDTYLKPANLQPLGTPAAPPKPLPTPQGAANDTAQGN